MSKIMNTYTVCQVTEHLHQDFVLTLLKPNQARITECKNAFQLNEAGLDNDDDFLAAGGIVDAHDKGVIKRLEIIQSKNAARATCMGGGTKMCFDVLYKTFNLLYGKSSDNVDAGINYCSYSTVTKVKLDKPIYGLFSNKMQQMIANWKNLSTGEVVKVVERGKSWKDSCHAMVDICEDSFNSYYKGQPQSMVAPTSIQFSISLPTNFYKLTLYDVKIQTGSVEEFQQNIYFISSDMPYDSHIQLVQMLDKD